MMLSDELLSPLMVAIEQRFGLVSKPLAETLRTALLEEARKLAISPADYAARLAGSVGKNEELAELIGRLLLGHTHFYRHTRVWEWLTTHLSKVAERAPVRALVAGCSTGEEAYTLASLLAANYGLNGFDVIAVDVNEQALQVARHGTYPMRDTTKLPGDWQRRYLVENGDGTVRFHPALKSRVKFACCNLTEGPPEGPYHLVMIRNVLTYMTPAATAVILEKLVKVVARPGLLVVAPHETFLVGGYTNLVPAADGLPVFIKGLLPEGHGTERGATGDASKPPIGDGLELAPVNPGKVLLAPTMPAQPSVAEVLPEPGFVLRPAAEMLHHRSAAWEELSVQLRELLSSRPAEAVVDLSAVLRMDNQVKLSIRAALRLLEAAGVQVELLPGAALRQERVWP